MRRTFNCEVFNHAFEAQMRDPRQEEAAHRIACAAVKRRYVKEGDRRRPRSSPAGKIVSRAASISAQIRAAWSRSVTPASVSAAPRVVRARS
jgi:ChaB